MGENNGNPLINIESWKVKEKEEYRMKILGGRLPEAGERFDRLQETAHKLTGGLPYRRGVYRFKTFAEFNQWKTSQAIDRPAHRGKTTS